MTDLCSCSCTACIELGRHESHELLSPNVIEWTAILREKIDVISESEKRALWGDR